jgi:hypothetical protein
MIMHTLEGSRGYEKTPNRSGPRLANRWGQPVPWALAVPSRPELLECSSYTSWGPIYVQLKSVYPTVIEGGHTDR